MSRFTEREEELIDALIGIQGRGRSASPLQLDEVEKAVKALESSEGVSDPTGSSLIEGRWHLMFTTRPGTASPIQLDDFDLVEGEWKMGWSSQIETNSWIENAANGLMWHTGYQKEWTYKVCRRHSVRFEILHERLSRMQTIRSGQPAATTA